MEDDEAARVVEQLLGEISELRERLDKLTAVVPEIVKRLASAPKPPDAQTPAKEFICALLEWIADSRHRGRLAERYLLLWQAKKLAEQSRSALPDHDEVVVLINAELSADELKDVDRMLEHGFKGVKRGRAIQVVGSRVRREFTESLSSEQRERFKRYMPVFVPFAGGDAVGPDAGGPPPADATPATPASSILASRAASLAIVAGVPAVAALAWFAVRGNPEESHDAPAALHDAGPTDAGRHLSSQGDDRPDAPAQPIDAAGGPSVIAPGPPSFTWARRTSGVTGQLMGIAWSGQLAVVVGGGGSIASSTDLETWSPAPQLSSYDYQSVAWGNGVFVAVGGYRAGNTGRIISTSADAETWSTQAWEERTALTGIVYGDGAFVAVGLRGAIVRSTDGATWQAVTSGSAEPLNGISHANGRFVSTAAQGAVLVSDDGVTWATTRRAGDHQYFRAAHDGARWFLIGTVAGRTAAVATSPDLKDLSEHQLPGASFLRCLVFAGNRLVAGGTDGALSSKNGLEWTVEIPASDLPVANDVLWTGSTLIAVGTHGAIYTAKVP